MRLFPAIDLYGGKAVRLLRGDYNNMTVYSDNPLEIADDFIKSGATAMHTVDLEGARDGGTPNFDTIAKIAASGKLEVQAGGGIRNSEVVSRYLDAGVSRVILGTAAVRDRAFLEAMCGKYGEKIAVGVDMKDGDVATDGWTKPSGIDCFDFIRYLDTLGVGAVICTDISRDGAMRGTNRELYGKLITITKAKIIASGGVSSLDDIQALRDIGVYGAIIGKAYYTGAVNLKRGIEVAEC